ncbi:unnamed protein product [Brassica rapa]|uniref:Uncharacterized protein n=1 Tax=Brassica campestris TaxID=3711 RepID=A0A3P6A3Z1_BRACM|nr:unnamed protein product [Brassica rapa]VDC87122.1 unnamed protein product [Brassica rapa]
MFNERNIWSRRRPSTTRPEKYKKLRDMERVPDKPDLTEVGGRYIRVSSEFHSILLYSSKAMDQLRTEDYLVLIKNKIMSQKVNAKVSCPFTEEMPTITSSGRDV